MDAQFSKYETQWQKMKSMSKSLNKGKRNQNYFEIPYHTDALASSKKAITTNFGKGKRGKKTFLIAGASINLSITYKNLYEDSSQKQKNRIIK